MGNVQRLASTLLHEAKTRFLVILDPDSVTTRCFSNRGPDGHWHGHPCLVCTAVDASNARYLVLRQTIQNDDNSQQQHQHLHVPHDAVAYMVECESEAAFDAGFRRLR